MKIFFPFVLLATICASVSGQSPSKILKASEKALGGERAVRALQPTTVVGTVKRSSDNAAGRFSLRTAKPNLFNIEYDLAGFETELGFNGRSGWMRDSLTGLRTLTGDASTDLQAMSAFSNSLWLDLKKERAKIASGGTATVNGKTANVVSLTTSKNVTYKLYFDRASSLLVRNEFPLGGYSIRNRLCGLSQNRRRDDAVFDHSTLGCGRAGFHG